MSNYYMGQKVLFTTSYFNKTYFWMQDGDGVVYLAKAKPVKALSIGSDGSKTDFVENYVPDFS